MSHQATFLGHFDYAVNLGRAAQRGAAGVATPTAMALFNAMEARALAVRGDRKDCEAASTRAEKWLEQRNPQNDPTWLSYFDEAELAAEFAHSYRDLNVSDKAIHYAERALSLHGPLYVRSKSFCKATLAFLEASDDGQVHHDHDEAAGCRITAAPCYVAKAWSNLPLRAVRQ